MPRRRTTDTTREPRTRMLGVHLTESEHAIAKALAATTGENLSVLFRTWLREQAKRKGIAA
ncbi:MAG: hypothetical protein HOO96_36025 [Polyangiaceae bacterium]|nr:hypothetical protein [Polyangiaceae bacterium]